jgi:hypothetical protein
MEAVHVAAEARIEENYYEENASAAEKDELTACVALF